MEVVFITNGKTKLVLIPEKETERVLLEDLLSKGAIKADIVKGPVDVLGTPAQHGLLLQAMEPNDTSKAEKVFSLHADEVHLEK